MTNTFSNRNILLVIAAACAALLGYALYLQHVLGLAPCPLCVLQRYAFLMVGLACLEAYLWRARPIALKFGVGTALLATLAGAGTAAYQLWVKANPHTSCGIDPIETALNKIFTAQWLPQMFYADGLCSADHTPILGLNIPQWSLVWFVVFSFALGFILFQSFKNKG